MPVEAIDITRWREMTEQADPGLYGSASWLEPTCKASGLVPLYLTISRGDTPALLVSAASRKRLGSRLVVTPAIAAYSGWAETMPADLSGERREGRMLEVTDELAQWLETDADYVRLNLPPQITDTRAFAWRGWSVSTRYTYLLHAGQTEESCLRTNFRRLLKRARESGLESRTISGDEAINALDHTIRETFARQGESLPVRQERWRNYLAAITDEQIGHVTGVYRGERNVATVLFGHDSTHSYELWAGSADSLEDGASVVGLWSAIQHAFAEGRDVDLAGANIPSISHFKRGFGGNLTPYHTVTWARSTRARFVAESAPLAKQALGRWLTHRT
jgi:GNAT acetyltransferase-like protein